jgi:hypothetical protein
MGDKKVCGVCLRYNTGEEFISNEGLGRFAPGFLKMRRDSQKTHIKVKHKRTK